MSSSEIEGRIAFLFPKGLETATGAKWQTVLNKLAAGDLVGARKHLNDLSRFVKLKMGSIELPPADRAGAATQLVLAMQTFVLNRCDLRPTDPCTTPPVGPDATFEVVAAGQAATVVTPSEHAGFHIDAGSTNEERTFFVVENQEPQEKKCDGPLPTKRCQYKLFYKFESFPDLPLNIAGHFGVCMSFAPGQGPLDYTSGEHPTQEVHGRIRLAHNKPDNTAKYVEGGHVEGDVEILPLTQHPTGFGQCTHPASAFRTHDGLLGVGERVLLAIANVVGKYVTPKNAYAYDQGFEHDALAFSDFNGLDAGNLFVTNATESGPDLAVSTPSAPSEVFAGDAFSVTYTVTNTSRPSGGAATAASQPTTANVYLYADRELTNLVAAGEPASVPGIAPDEVDPLQTITQSITVPAGSAPGEYFVVVRVTPPSTGLAEVDGPLYANNISIASIVVKQKAILGSGVLVFGDYPNRTIAAEILTGMGYAVTTQTTLPADLSPYNVIWHVGAFVALTSEESSRLAAFLGIGGGVHLTGERPCCDVMNASLGTLVNTVVVAGGVTVGNQGDINPPYPFNATAFGAVTTSPNSLTSWNPSSPGGILGVSGVNVLATGSSCFPAVTGCGTVVGAVWGESHLQGGKGRLTLLMDVNWFANEGASTVMSNIQTYLNHGAAASAASGASGASASLISLSAQAIGRSGKNRPKILDATARSVSEPSAPKTGGRRAAPRRQ